MRELRVSDATFARLRELKCRLALSVFEGRDWMKLRTRLRSRKRKVKRIDVLMSFDDVISYLIHLYEDAHIDKTICHLTHLLDPERAEEGLKNVVRTVSERGKLTVGPEDLENPVLRETLEALVRAGLAKSAGGGYRLRPKWLWKTFIKVEKERDFNCFNCRFGGFCPLWRISR